MSDLAAVILSKNEQSHIRDCVGSLGWADRVVVVDTFSEDDTVTLARSAGAHVIQHAFSDFSQIRNVALQEVQADWIFFVDADERATPDLAAEIRQVIVERPENGWWVPRLNYLFGKLTLGAGWYPDYQMRLLRRDKARYERPVHEIVVLDGASGHLQNPLIHHNYATVAQFHAKQRRYSTLDASILYQEGVRPRPYTPATQFLRHFSWRFFELRGYRDGLHGLRLCLLTAWYQGLTYRKLGQLWRN